MKKLTIVIGLLLVMCLLAPVSCAAPPAPMPAPESAPAPAPAPEPIPTPTPTPEPTPATFTISDLSISPTEINTGEEITISVLISNIGDEVGECLIHFEVNDEPLHLSHHTLEGGESEWMEIGCAVSLGGGTYSVNVNGLIDTATFAVSHLSGTFTIKGKPSPIVVTGSGDKTSRPFTIATDEWVIDWSYVPDPEYPEMAVFGFFVYPRGETAVYVESVLFPESTSGSTYSYAGAGQYYIKVTAGNVKSWEVVIKPTK